MNEYTQSHVLISIAKKKPLMSKKCLRNLVLDDPKLGEIYYKN